MIIIASAQHLEPWFTGNLANDILVGVSDSGYSCDVLSLEWLKHFECFSADKQVGKWRLFVVLLRLWQRQV